MMTAEACLPTVSKFDQTLARHLAAHIAEGSFCDEPLVRGCYARTRKDLGLTAHASDDSVAEEIETCFVQAVVGLMKFHQRFIASLPERIAGVFIFELLFDRSW